MMIDLPARTQSYALDSYQADLQSICGAFHVAPCAQDRTLLGHLSVTTLAGLDLTQVGLEGVQVARTRREIREDPGDHFFLIMQREGHSILEQNDNTARMLPGDMFLVDATRESLFRYGDGYSLQL